MNIEKLENSERILELNPSATLEKIGFGKDDVLCDIGAGTGIFTIPAAKITANKVFAIEINEELIKIIQTKARSENLNNIKTLKIKDNQYDILDNTFDFVLLVTVFHEIKEKNTLLTEISRIIKKTGRLVIIDFHDRQTKFGPPVTHRIGKNFVNSICVSYGFIKHTEFDLSDNFYCIVLKYMN